MPRGIYPRPLGMSKNKRHDRVRRARGKASEHKCVQCGDKARDWATIHGKDGMYPEDYQAMCRSCHLKYDWTPERSEAIRQRQTGRKRPDVARRNQAATGWKHTPEAKARIADGVRRYRKSAAG